MPDCTHHWRIDEPNGPVSEGVCQKCGVVRMFVNSDLLDGAYGPLSDQERRKRAAKARQRIVTKPARRGEYRRDQRSEL